MTRYVPGRRAAATPDEQTALLDRNQAQQAAVYGEPLGTVFGRVSEQLGLTQSRIAAILGLSSPMLSQLASGHRVKIGNPVAVKRLQALVELTAAVAAGRVQLADVEPRLIEVAAQAAVITQGTPSGAIIAPTAAVRIVQGLFRSVASAEDLLDAAAMIAGRHPEIAQMLRVFGAGRTADAVAHFESSAL